MTHQNINDEYGAEIDINTDEQRNEHVELDDLLNDALNDFNSQTTSTQTVENERKTSTISTGTDESITGFNKSIQKNNSTDGSPSKTVRFDLDDDEHSNNDDKPLSNEVGDNCDEVNMEYVDKLLNDFQQKMNDVMENMTYPDENVPENNNLFTEAMQKQFCKMAQDTMNSLINERITNKKTNSPSNSPTKNDTKDFKSIISEAIKNLCKNSKDLDGGLLMNSSDEIAKLINNLTFNDGEDIDENEIEEHFTKVFVKIGQTLLYPRVKEICEKYPAYLKNNQFKLLKETYENYEKQYANMVLICKIFEEDDAEMSQHKFENILTIMQEIKNCGLPPEELIEVKPYKMYDDIFSELCNQNLNTKNEQCCIS